MKGNFWKKLLTFMSCIVATLGLMCFVSCAADAGSDSDDNNTDKLVLDFNGGTMFGHKTVEFSIEDITPHVGKAIDEALASLGVTTASIKKTGFYLHGWTLKKNAEICVETLPTFGTLYAKWGTTPLTPEDEDVPLTLTLNFNGGKLDGASFKYFDNSKVAKYADKTIDEALEGLGITTITKENYELVGWTDNLITANEVTTLPTKGNVTLYAIWQFNGTANPLTLTLDFNGGTSGEESYFVLTDDLIADYKGMPIAKYFTEKNKPLPTKEGYTLIGWSTTRNGEDTIVDIPLEGTVKYYAVWEEVGPEKLTFTLDAGKGLIALDAYNEDSEKVKTISTEFEAGATLEEVLLSLPSVMPVFESLPDNDDAYCYEEKGVYYYPYAYSDRKGSVVKLGVNTEIPDITLTKDTTFYIEYRKCVDVLFNLNGGYRELEEEKSSENFKMSMGFYFSMLWSSVGDNLKIKRDGYVLEGFTYTKDGSDFATEVPLKDCTLYAKWAEPKECTLTLKSEPYSTFIDDNGKPLGSELKITYTTGSTLGEILEQKNMKDYFVDESELKYKSYIEFVGFVAEDILYYEDSVPTKDLTLSVKTQPIQLRVSFDYNEGTDNNGKTSFDKVVLGEDIQNKISKQSIASIIEEYNVPTPTKEGYKLVGWGYDTETPIDVIDKTVEELLSEKAYLDLYAVWQEKDEPTDPEPEKLTYTWDAGEGFFYDYVTDEFIKTISVEFDAGATVDEIYELLIEEHSDHINPMYCFEEDGIEYSYKADGIYYIVEEIKDNKGNVIMNVWTNTGTGMSSNQKIYEDITYYFSYVKVVKITYKLEGGYVIEYDHESDKEIKITDDIKGFGVEGYKEFSVNDPKRDGYVFMGWTRTKDGNDFVTVVPSEETELYAKWELPKECVLTINAGEYSQLFDRDGNSLGREVNLTFTSGKTIDEVLEENNIDYYYIVNRFEIEDALYRTAFVDSEENYYSPYGVLKDSITLYPQPTRLDEDEGILKYYDYVNDYGNYDEKAEPGYEETRDFDIFREYLNTPHADGYIFVGWTYTPNGNDYVNLGDYIPAGVTTTVYARWIPEGEVKPLYEYSSDNSQITFTFVPSYFGYDWDSDEFHEVQLMSEAVGWDPSEKRLMEKDSDGNYTVTVPYNAAAYNLYQKWSGFKFYVFEDKVYLGPTQCKISSYDVINMGDPNFNLKLATSNLTIDLNGGNIKGDTSSLEYEVDGYIGTSMNGFIEGFKGVTVKEGYVFAGWTLTEDGDDYVDYVPGGINTIYAKWIIPSTQTITLIARDGDEFYNWNDEPLGNEVSFEFEVGITLNELLSQNNMSYHSMLRDYESNSEIISFTNFVDVSGNIYTDSKILASDIVLTAQYSVQAKITFDLNGGQFESGEENNTIVVDYESNQYYLDWYEKPTKEGYKFIGWTSTKDGDDFINDITGPIPNGIVYAKWQDPLKLFDNGDLIGDFAVIKSELKDGTIAWVYDEKHGLNLTYEGEGVYSATFTYYDYMCGWDQDTDYCDFKIRAVAGSWQGASYGVADYLNQPELDGDEVLCDSNNAPNVRIPAEEGITYKVTFRCASDGNVYVKIATVK